MFILRFSFASLASLRFVYPKKNAYICPEISGTIMEIPTLYSAKRIERQFYTGEEPVMVMCSDVNLYVCKYMRSSATAYKLACELIGATLAKKWQLTTPDIAFINIYFKVRINK